MYWELQLHSCTSSVAFVYILLTLLIFFRIIIKVAAYDAFTFTYMFVLIMSLNWDNQPLNILPFCWSIWASL